jgi:transcriptional regulator with XRE-family HTH domain
MEVRAKEKYGLLLRKLREQSGKSMGALARHLGLTTPYLCDVELGRRAPLSTSHTIKAANFLGVDPQSLIVVAVECREAVEFKTPKSTVGREAVAALLRRSDDFTDEEWGDLQAFLDARGKL